MAAHARHYTINGGGVLHYQAIIGDVIVEAVIANRNVIFCCCLKAPWRSSAANDNLTDSVNQL